MKILILNSILAVLLITIHCKPPSRPNIEILDSSIPKINVDASIPARVGSFPVTPVGACDNLSLLECPESKPKYPGISCSVFFERVLETGSQPVSLICMSRASTKEDARNCPGIVCP